MDSGAFWGVLGHIWRGDVAKQGIRHIEAQFGKQKKLTMGSQNYSAAAAGFPFTRVENADTA